MKNVSNASARFKKSYHNQNFQTAKFLKHDLDTHL